MPKTYAQIRREQKLFEDLFPERRGMSSADYAELMSRVTPGEYEAGKGRGLGKVIKGASYGIDQFLEKIGAPKEAGKVGNFFFGEPGRQAFEGLPRALINMAPMAVPGGTVATAALMGADTYEKTDSPLAGIISGGSAFLFPGAGRLGGKAAVGLGGKLGLNTARTLPMALQPGVGLVKGLAQGGTQLAGGGVLKSAAARGVEFLGQQAGYLGLGQATQSVVGGITAPEGHRLEAMAEPWKLENLAVSALANLPFLAGDVPRLRAQNKEAKFVRDYANTLERYDQTAWQPMRNKAVGDQLRAEMDARMAKARTNILLKNEKQFAREDTQVKIPRVEQDKQIAEVKGLLDKARKKKLTAAIPTLKAQLAALQKERGKPIELGWSEPWLVQPELEMPTDVVAKVEATAGNPWVTASLAGRSQAVTSTDPQASLAASLMTNEVKPSEAREEVLSLTNKGMSVEDAVAKVGTKHVNRAKRKLTREEKDAAAKAKAEQDKAAQDATDQEHLDYVTTWMADPAVPQELKSIFQSNLGKLESHAADDANIRMASALRNWKAPVEADKHAKSLDNYLGSTANALNSLPIDKSAGKRQVVKDHLKVSLKDATPAQIADARAAASIEAESLRMEPPDPTRYYQVDGTKVVSFPYLETSVHSDEGRKLVAAEADQLPDVLAEVDDLIQTQAARAEEQDVVELWKEELGVDLSPEAVKQIKEMDEEALVRAKEQLRKLLKSGKVVAGASDKVKKFLGLVPGTAGLSAGGGFWYNLGKFDPVGRSLGKYKQLPKDHVVPVEQFTRIGRGTDQPLPKQEVELLRQLVPEAFDGDKVNMETLYRLLPQREPSVEVKTLYGEDGSPSERRYAQVIHELDTLHPNWRSPEQTYDEQTQKLYNEYKELSVTNSQTHESSARWSSIAPRSESDMPGYVEGLVRVPRAKLSGRDVDRGADYDIGSEGYLKKPLFRGPHFGSEDTNVVGFFRGYMETLPDGTKAFHVIEVQSDWGQSRREDLESTVFLKYKAAENGEWQAYTTQGENVGPTFKNKDSIEKYVNEWNVRNEDSVRTKSYPLLTAYENLALKAAIKHARENGATKLILSDAETAMMSEGHDASGNVSRFEGGMRLHYDTTLPSEMRRISGDKGERVELGVHEKAKSYNGRDELRAGDVHPILDLVGSPVFRDASGKPKTQITGTLYDISKVPVSEQGTGKPFGAPAEPAYMGERMLLGRLLEDVGLGGALDETAAVLSLIDNPDVAWAKLLGTGDNTTPSEQLPLGLHAVLRDGERLIMLRADRNAPEIRSLFAATHEFIGHHLWSMADAGKLDAETTQRMNNGRQFIADNTPQENQLVLKEMLDMLPKRYKDDADLRKAMLETSGDPDEVLANVNAIAALALVDRNMNPKQLRSFFQWMPKPLVDLFAVFARMGRKMYESISGLLFARDMGWARGRIDPEVRKQLHGYIDSLYEVLKFDQERVAQTKQALKLDMASGTPREFSQALADGAFNDPVTSAGSDIVQLFGGPPKGDKEPNMLTKGLRGLSKWSQHTLLRQASLAVKYPQFRRLITSYARMELAVNQMVDKVLVPLGLEKKGTALKADKTNPIYRVAESPLLSEARDRLVHRAQEQKKTVQQMIDEGDSTVKAELGKLSADQQQLVREAIVRHEAVQNGMTDISHQALYEKLKKDYMGVLMLQDRTLGPDAALQQAEQAVELLKSGQMQPATSNEAWLAQQGQRIESRIAEFRNHPEWITHRRFGKFAQRVFKKDGSYSTKDFQTQAELDQWRRTNAAALDSGELRLQQLRKDKEAFNVAESGLEFIQNRVVDKREDVIAGLEQLGIDHDAAVRFAESQMDLAGEIRKELAARQLPSATPHRKLVEGYQELDTLFQQVEFMQAVTRNLGKSVMNSESSARLLDPAFEGKEDVKRTIKQALDNARLPDAKSVRAINMASYLMYMTLHPLNMLQDMIQPLTGALPSVMINDGAGISESFGRITKAMADVKREGSQTPFEREMLDRFRKGNRGLASFTDMESNEYLKITNLNRIAKGMHPLTTGELLKRPLDAGILWQKNLHKMFTNFGMESSMLAAFRHFKRKGLADAEAEASAFDLASVAMDSLGRGGRAAGVWSADKMRPVSAILTTLQTYAFHQIGTWKATFERAIGEVPGLGPEGRKQAWKALGTHTALMMTQAGILGLPFVGAMLALVDKLFGINSKEEVAKAIQDQFGSEDSHFVQQAALHGLVNAMGGVDYASRAQTPGVLGLNARDGFSPESLLGPTYSIAENLIGGLGDAAQGEVWKGVSRAVLPNNLRRAAQAWRDEWEFRRQDGSLIDESTPMEQSVYAVLGLKPSRIASLQERDSWQRADAEIQQKERAEWLDDVSELLMAGDNAGAKTAILERVADRPGESPAGLANAVAERLINKTSPKDVSQSPGASEGLNRTTGLPSYTMGEVEKLNLQDQILRRLGLGLPPGRGQLQRAQQIDQIRSQQPWLSYREASQQVDQMMGRSEMQALLGAGYGQRVRR